MAGEKRKRAGCLAVRQTVTTPRNAVGYPCAKGGAYSCRAVRTACDRLAGRVAGLAMAATPVRAAVVRNRREPVTRA